MTETTTTAAKSLVIDILTTRAAQLGFEGLDIDGSFDFFESGLLDSLGLIDLIDQVESRYDLQVDLTAMDPEDFTTVDGLVRSLVAASE